MRCFNSICLRVALCVATVVTLSHNAAAASSSGGFSVRGIGAQTCAQISAIEGEAELAALVDLLAAWGAGYLSYMNRSAQNTYDAVPITDNAVLARIVINVCRSNPQSLIESVFANLADSFKVAAQADETPWVEAVNGQHKSTVRQAVLRNLQAVLIAQHKLPANSADGQFGPRTRDALLAFQKERALPETGVPDPATLIAIFITKG